MHNEKCLILLNYNGVDLITDFIEYMGMEECVLYKTIIVDNGSTDGSYEKLKQMYGEYLDVICTYSNLGYAGGNNYGFHFAMKKYHPEIVIYGNPDIKVKSSVLKEMLYILNSDKDIKLVGCKILDIENQEQLYAWKLPGFFTCTFSLLFLLNKLFIKNERKYKPAYLSKKVSEVEVVSGSLFAVDANVFKEIGGFDNDTFLYGEENIIGKKLKDKKYKAAVLNNEMYLHIHSVSIDNSMSYYHKFTNVVNGKKIYLFKYLKINRICKLIFYFISSLAKLERKLICNIFFKKHDVKSH